MLAKPESCKGCPLWGDGKGFVPDSIPAGATVLALFQNPGENEEVGRRVVGYNEHGRTQYEPCTPQPMIGKTGYVWQTKLLPQAGLQRDEVAVCNVLRCRQQVNGVRSNDMPTGETLKKAVAHCTQAHLRVPDTVELIITGGQHAWALMGGLGDVTEWRGYIQMPSGSGPTRPVLATLHPAYLLRDPSMDIPTRRDWGKVQAILAGKYPKPLPPVRAIESAADERIMDAWFRGANEHAPYVVIDTEYDPATKLVWLIGMGYPGMEYGLQLRWLHASLPPYMRAIFSDRLEELIFNRPVVMFNAIADVQSIRKTWNHDWEDYKFIHDPMQAHACLWSEWPHDLNFVASVYSPYEPTKHLMDTDPMKYNWGDVCHTMAVWEAIQGELDRDLLVKAIYEGHNLKMLPAIDASMQVGLAVDEGKVEQCISDYEDRMYEATAIAQAYCGWPINLGSPMQLKAMLHNVEGLPVQKHPKTKKPTIDKDALAELRKLFLGYDPEEKPTVETMLANIEAGGHPLLESAFGYARNEHALSSYLYPLVGDGDN